MLGLGALLVAAMVILVDGRVEARRIVAVVCCCYAPLLTYSVAVLVAILAGAVDGSGLAGVTDARTLLERVHTVVPAALAPLAPVRYLSVVGAFAMGWSLVRSECRLTAPRTAVVLGVCVLFNLLVASVRPV